MGSYWFLKDFHLLTVTKALEKDVGKVKFAGYLNNKRILIYAVSKKQQDDILKMAILDG